MHARLDCERHDVRTVVGAPVGSDKANEDVAPVQAKVVEALDLSHLERVARATSNQATQLPIEMKETRHA